MIGARIRRLSAAATISGHGGVGVIDEELVARKAADSRANPRGREVHVLHAGDADSLQRMLNALQPGSYVPPHRHEAPATAESVILLRGAVGVVPFHDDGTPDDEGSLVLCRENGVIGVDLRAGAWHTLFALEPDTVVFEVKSGPYDPGSARRLAPWAPAEGEAGAREYLARLEDLVRSRHALEPRSWSAEAGPKFPETPGGRQR